jgi:hypothetical protein
MIIEILLKQYQQAYKILELDIQTECVCQEMCG